MKPPANTASNPVSDRQVRALLRKLSGPGFAGREDRALAIKQLKSFGCARAYPTLLRLLNHRDLDVRCNAAEAILGINAQHGLPHVLPLLRARSKTLRWSVCGLLHDFGDSRALAPLIERLQIDRDAQNRGTSAYALGGIGLLQAIPALVQTEQLDHEIDIMGIHRVARLQRLSVRFCGSGHSALSKRIHHCRGDTTVSRKLWHKQRSRANRREKNMTDYRGTPTVQQQGVLILQSNRSINHHLLSM